MVNVLRALIKATAVGRIFFALAGYTIEAFKMAWHIISTSPEVMRDDKADKLVFCKECHSCFWADENELKHRMVLCESCSDDLVRDQLKK